MHIQWIGLRPGRRQPLQSVEQAEVNTIEGLVGDHYKKSDGRRHVTLIHADALAFIGEALDRGPVDPGLTRRNIVLAGGNGQLEKGDRFRIGDEVEIEITGPCNPCDRMRENLGEAGFRAMTGKAGWTARVLTGGSIRTGDTMAPGE